MERSGFITAVLLAAVVPVAACNYAYSDKDAVDSRATTTPAGESAVATSGTLPVREVLDDSTVTSRIQAKFFLDQAIKVRRIDVDTHGGIVTLRGDVASDNERAQALLLARTTEGVERVEDALTVNAAIDSPAPDAAATAEVPPPSKADDEALTSRVQARFGEEPSLKAATITVTAKDGVVLLDGVAPTAAAKQQAITAARSTEGVLQVIDRITVGRSR
jgi:hyperosmotically inducible periplasmic protein